VVALHGSVSAQEVAWMGERIRFLLQSGRTDSVVCDVSALDEPDAAAVDGLARMQLAARRAGGRVILRGACGELRDLLELAGLTDVLPCEEELALQPGRQAEQGEQASGVKEEGDAAEPVARDLEDL
jgi:anti-anti-sigma regulatory factor